MKKMTVAEKRNNAIYKLLSRNENMTEADARKAMNAYYRLCGMNERLLYLEDNERTCNKKSTKELSERAEVALRRVNGYFEPFNATLVYFGYLPTICEKGSTRDLYLAHFYERTEA